MSASVFDAKTFLASVSTQPGVYQMFDSDDKLLYVGKAKNLKNRLNSYFRRSGLSPKTQILVSKIASIQVTLTDTESDALVVEQNLIKSLKPIYNISLRDDKSYPYIFVSDDEYPRITFHRGLKKRKGQYYGPFPSAAAVYQTLHFLQKTFRIRQCENSVFNHRSRPCLQYQINRCTAPCVKFISTDDYRGDIDHAQLFLQGESNQLMTALASQMDAASSALNFEKAALLRDQIALLRTIQSEHNREIGSGKIDIFALHKQAAQACIHSMFIRDGRILGSRSYFPEDRLQSDAPQFLLAFLAQFYLSNTQRELPGEIIVNQLLPANEQLLLLKVLSEKSGRKISISHKVRAQRYKWLSVASTTAQQNLSQHLSSKANLQQRFAALQEVLGLDEPPARMECFDISHSSGELTVASCVVFNQQGPLKSDYRRFNIEGIQGGDDYAAMAQALERRYTRVQQEEGLLPDLLIIDGGKGQLSQAQAVLDELGLAQLMLLGIAKGTSRKPGFETLVFSDGREQVLTADAPALHLLQTIRDEAHRFAITGHKQRRDKKRKTSALESIPGVGATRRRALLRYFGGLQTVREASVEQLSKVPGISKKIAEDIYNNLHQQ
ncbi:MAG: excinuclease ABC subunit UvrC [Cellvibrionaceae bacterium]|nr:excinuclease ABC subunit UvrC [Cellvibrionaceae bacterium]